MSYFTSLTASLLYLTMLRDKTQASGTRNAKSADPEASQSRATRGSNQETATLGSKGRKTASTLKESRNTLNNSAAARKWLAKEELLIDGEEITPAALSQALLWVAAGERNTVEQLVDAIRAVALCLEECEGREVVESALIEIKLSAAQWVEEAKGVLKKAADEVVEEAKKKVNEGGKRSWSDQMADLDNGSVQDWGRSYAKVAASGPRLGGLPGRSQIDYDYLASESLKRRKLLVDGLEGVTNAAGGLTPREIVEKANIALTAARLGTDGNGLEPRIDPKAMAAKVLENGGVVLELETEEAVEWLKDPGVRKAFEDNFGGSTKVVDQLFHVIVSFLPVTLRDTLSDSIAKVEAENEIEPGTIVKSRWLKAPKYWKEGQRFAHAVLSFTDRSFASTVIQKGIIVEGQRFKAKKMEELPRRCFKCQRIGHMANNCQEISVICPNCAGAHEGNVCSATTDKFRCINCSKAGKPSNHAAWDWGCTSMEAAKRRKNAKNLDSQFRFFPTDEEWTWARRDIYSDEEAQGLRKEWNEEPRGGFREGRADKGWKGMKDARATEAATGGAGEWTTVGPRYSSRNVGTQEPRNSNVNPTRVATGSNVTLSQLDNRGASQRSSSRRGIPESGRQSRLGDFWSGKNGVSGGGQDNADGHSGSNPSEANLC